VRIAAVQAGHTHYAQGNPVSKPTSTRSRHKLAPLRRNGPTFRVSRIHHVRLALSGRGLINGLAEPVPGDGPWSNATKALARETRTPLVGAGRNQRWPVIQLRLPARCGVATSANTGRCTPTSVSRPGGLVSGRSVSAHRIPRRALRFQYCADMWYPETVRCQTLLGGVILHSASPMTWSTSCPRAPPTITRRSS